MDKIFLKNLRLRTRLGIHAWEQQVEQTVSIDLYMHIDAEKAATTDDINKNLNYFTVAERIEQLLATQHYRLVESLAEAIAKLLQNEFAVPWLSLTVGKPNAVTKAELVGVTIERSLQKISAAD